MKRIKCIHCDSENLCSGHITGILTRNEIKQYGLIKEGLNEDSLQGTSYDLRLGEGHFVYKTDQAEGKNKWMPYWIGETDDFNEANKVNPHFEYAEQRKLQIAPFGAALIQLKETIDTRTCCRKSNVLICGHFDLKLLMVIKGFVSQQATQVEPNYIGKLFCFLFNQTGETIELSYKDKIATIEFFYVSCSTYCNSDERKALLDHFDDSHRKGHKYQESNGNEIKVKTFCNEHGINDVRFFWAEKSEENRLPSHGGLNYFYEKFGHLQKEVNQKINELNPDSLIAKTKKSLNTEIKSFKSHLKWVAGIIIVIATLVLGGGLSWKLLDIYQKKIEQIEAPFNQKREEFNKFLDERLKQSKAEMEKFKNSLNLKVINDMEDKKD